MDRPSDLEEVATEDVREYVKFLEESNTTASEAADSWRKAYEQSESEKREMQKRLDLAMRQGSNIQFTLERTERSLRESYQKEGILNALLEQERQARVRAEKEKDKKPEGPQS